MQCEHGRQRSEKGREQREVRWRTKSGGQQNRRKRKTVNCRHANQNTETTKEMYVTAFAISRRGEGYPECRVLAKGFGHSLLARPAVGSCSFTINTRESSAPPSGSAAIRTTSWTSARLDDHTSKPIQRPFLHRWSEELVNTSTEFSARGTSTSLHCSMPHSF